MYLYLYMYLYIGINLDINYTFPCAYTEKNFLIKNEGLKVYWNIVNFVNN